MKAALLSLETKFGLTRKRTKEIEQDENSQDMKKKKKKTNATSVSPKEKKPRKAAVAICSENQELSELFQEIAGYCFKSESAFKGQTYSKVAAAIRHAEEPLLSGKQAMKLKGIGKSSGAKIDEFLEKGSIELLEEYRSGNKE